MKKKFYLFIGFIICILITGCGSRLSTNLSNNQKSNQTYANKNLSRNVIAKADINLSTSSMSTSSAGQNLLIINVPIHDVMTISSNLSFNVDKLAPIESNGTIDINVNYNDLIGSNITRVYLRAFLYTHDGLRGNTDSSIIIPVKIKRLSDSNYQDLTTEPVDLISWHPPYGSPINETVQLKLEVDFTNALAQGYYNMIGIELIKETNDLPFLTVSGTNITKEDGTLKLRGMALTNGVYYINSINDLKTSEYILNQTDYDNIASTGCNAVRFYLQYDWLDNNTDRTQFYEFLDEQIEFAKKAGIYIILNLHYFSTGQTGGFYAGEVTTSKENILEFWKRISDRYKDNPNIAAYDLINEPRCFKEASNHTEEKLYDTYQYLVSGLRDHGDNHILMIADPLEKHDFMEWKESTGVTDNLAPYSNTEAFIKIDDNNLVYTFHWYKPSEFTHQSYPWNDYFEMGAVYPFIKSETEYKGGWYNDSHKISNYQWEKYEGQWVNLDDLSSGMTADNLKFNISLSANGNNGTVWFDDIELRKRPIGSSDEGTIIPILNSNFKYMNKNKDAWPFPANWYCSISETNAPNAVFKLDMENSNTDDGSGSLYFKGMDNDLWESPNYAGWKNAGGMHSTYFDIEAGYEYQITVWYKAINLNYYVVACGYDFYDVTETVYDKNYNLTRINDYYKAWADENDVPLYCGEFGVADPSQSNPGFANSPDHQINWMKDTIDILNNSVEHWTYHDYKDYTNIGFGLFDDNANPTIKTEFSDSIWQ